MATGVRPRARHARRDPRGVVVARTVGELLITLAVVLLLFVVHQLWFTNAINAWDQGRMDNELEQSWAQDDPTAAPARAPAPAPQTPAELTAPSDVGRVVDGHAFAKIYLPTLGESYAVVEGTSQDDLALGPGHYPESALPGEPGNLAIAGHRVGRGAPFNRLAELGSCAPLVVETGTAWFVYRVLPLDGEADDWRLGRGADPRCAGVAVPTGPYAGLVGQELVTPHQVSVVAPIPTAPGREPSIGEMAGLITLTTCHPEYSARERLIVHGVLTARYPKDDTNPQPPAELTEAAVPGGPARPIPDHTQEP